MKHRVRGAVIGALLLAALVPPIAGQAVSRSRSTGWRGQSTMLGGTPNYSRGEYIFQGFVYDDGGRDNNTADVVETRAAVAGDDLRVRLVLNSMFPAGGAAQPDIDHVVVGLAWGESALPRDWPFGAGMRSPWQQFATITSSSVLVTDEHGATTTRPAPVVNLADHTIEVTLPGAAKGHRVRLAGGAGSWDPAAQRWVAGSLADLVFNPATVEPFTRHGMRDEVMQQAIAAANNASFAVTLDLDGMRAGRTDPITVTPGRYDRIYKSVQHLPGGYRTDDAPRMLGMYQTYFLYVPGSYRADRPNPLAVVLHSLNNTNNEFTEFKVYEHLAEARGALAITPLALGTDGWYWDEALVDTLDALHDLKTHYAVDDERVTLSGYSMGGLGTYRLATLLPDQWASAALWAGVPAYYIWAWPAPPISAGHDSRQSPGMTYDQLDNVGEIPFMIAHGTHDELVPVAGVTHMTERLRELGHTYRYDLYPGVDHFSFDTINDWTRWGEWLSAHPTRTVNPATVDFKVRPQAWFTGSPSEIPIASGPGYKAELYDEIRSLGFDLRSAYWVRDVQVAGEHAPTWDADVIGHVQLTSLARPDRAFSTVDRSDASHAAAAPFLIGSSNQAGPPYSFATRAQDRVVGDVPADQLSNGLAGTLRGVSEVTVDLRRAGLHLDGLDTSGLASDTDGTVVHLVDGAQRRDLVLTATL
jgi:predicted esterase